MATQPDDEMDYEDDSLDSIIASTPRAAVEGEGYFARRIAHPL